MNYEVQITVKVNDAASHFAAVKRIEEAILKDSKVGAYMHVTTVDRVKEVKR